MGLLLLHPLPGCCLPTHLLIPGQGLLGQVEFGVSAGSVGMLTSGKPAIHVLPVILWRGTDGIGDQGQHILYLGDVSVHPW